MPNVEDADSRGLYPAIGGSFPSIHGLWGLGIALGVGTVVGISYLLTHPYPAYGAGLYLQIAEQIVDNGYRLPVSVPNYTADGVPFAYPPLMFYVSAVLMDVGGVTPLALSRYLPVVVTTLYLVPYYFLSRELLDSNLEATIATTLLAVTPPTLQWHLSAGGLVRAPAFLFALAGIYVGVKLFRSGSALLLFPATILFGLTVLTHPVYTVFFVVSYLLVYAVLDRSIRGLFLGAVVGFGGIALAAPWWLRVISIHGADVFTSAAGTHSGLLGGPGRILEEFVYTLAGDPSSAMFFVLAYAGMFYVLGTGRVLLPAWLLTAGLVLGKHRFQFVAGSMLAAVLLSSLVENAVRERIPAGSWRWAPRVALAVVVVASVSVGALYGAGGLAIGGADGPDQPQFIDGDDRRAMLWVGDHTNRSAGFVVLGDVAEWFPMFTDRTILVGPWGVEWTSPKQYATQLSLYENVSTCPTERCVTEALGSRNLTPEYLYVPKGTYTIRGAEYEGTAGLRHSLVSSDRYRLVYENEGASVFRVTNETESTELVDVPSVGGPPSPVPAR
ncbi:ArnT family glycosyltransferase [Halorarum salinum]|uniref:Glycosyltransferase RgtA/B/C/D-like domain-containing protein n=1 Tax=Halorarum salinum TaxID=2743089 RepID=A0A7D5L850_9EURY|nr:hypothetical protein [Halobaculum salinum]QLG60373.1 hypothetical protein HUG12_00840 [Halobaculum salinum]